jgi:hypothetical protein
MTVENKIRAMLYKCGMFDFQAVAVVELMKEDPANDSIQWDANVDNCPPEMVLHLWEDSVKVHALKYIDANCPTVWFRSQFAG